MDPRPCLDQCLDSNVSQLAINFLTLCLVQCFKRQCFSAEREQIVLWSAALLVFVSVLHG